MNVKIPYGLKDEQLWFVTDVPNGNKCGCICPDCKSPLQARNNPNNKKRPYFAHAVKVECTYTGMTDVHRMAQQILDEHKYIITPEYRKIPQKRCRDGSFVSGTEVVIRPKRVDADEVVVEYSWEGFKPDVLFKKGDKQLFIEIAVTHFIEEEKRKAVKRHDIAMLELDLSWVSESELFDKQKFTEIVLNPGVYATWIHNPKGYYQVQLTKKKLQQEVDNKNKVIQVDDEKHAMFAKLREEELERLKPLLDQLDEAGEPEWKSERYREINGVSAKNMKIMDWQETLPQVVHRLVDVEVKNDWILNASRINWQTYVIELLLSEYQGVQWNPNDIKRAVVNECGVIEFMWKLNIEKQQHRAKVKREGFDYATYSSWYLDWYANEAIISPMSPVMSYISYLKSTGLVRQMKNKQYYALAYGSLDEYATETLRKNQERVAEMQKMQQLREEHQRRAIRSEMEWMTQEEARKNTLRDDISARIELMVAADRRLFREGDGEGYCCNQCQMGMLPTDERCPFCQGGERTPYEVMGTFLDTAKQRYRSDDRPAKSVAAAPELDIECLVDYIES